MKEDQFAGLDNDNTAFQELINQFDTSTSVQEYVTADEGHLMTH